MMMATHLTYEVTIIDQLKLFCHRWEPVNESRSVLCLVHELGEHSGHYAYFAEVVS
jgi:alpha-beta hydrolase superfamily lysophospholipase